MTKRIQVKLTKEEKDYLINLHAKAIRDHDRYVQTARIFEEYAKTKELDEDTLYCLGNLYEHMVYGPQGKRLGRKIVPLKRLSKKSLRNITTAKKLFLTALKKDPKHINGLRGMGKYYLDIGEYRKSLVYFKKAHKLGHQNTSDISILYGLLRDYDRSLFWHTKNLEANPRSPMVVMNYLTISNKIYRKKMRKYAKFLEKNFQKGFGHLSSSGCQGHWLQAQTGSLYPYTP
jgi:tetratricopeptide (TPR) repeat protein